MNFVMYILCSGKSGRYYVGHTSDIANRLFYHNTGKVTATRNKGPWIVFIKNISNLNLKLIQES